jgi:murein DD-endopeptidase MepM/ murein hydrolase activator NlpD
MGNLCKGEGKDYENLGKGKDKALYDSLFWSDGTPWQHVNLDDLYVQKIKMSPLDMKKEKDQDALLSYAKKEKTRTYGGFGEVRKNIWKGFEPENPIMLHLGIDFNNLEPDTIVYHVTDGKVIHVMLDFAKFNGWGGRVIVHNEQKDLYVMYGHLNPYVLPVTGAIVRKGESIGRLGSFEQNGGWFCHLHLQVMTKEFVQRFDGKLDKLDGYWMEENLPNGVLNPMTVEF